VELQAATCSCGFDLVSKDTAAALVRARRDRSRGYWLLLLGLAGAASLAFLLGVGSTSSGVSLAATRGGTRLVLLLVGATIFGVGRGQQLIRNAGRRLVTARSMQALPVARVVRVRPD
jgi:hypothetical protein